MVTHPDIFDPGLISEEGCKEAAAYTGGMRLWGLMPPSKEKEMKKLLPTVVAGIALAASFAVSAQSHSVKGHYRSDGTYVQPHYRSNANSTKLDNYSTEGNYNPYNGKSGTVDPYKPTQSNPYGSPYNQPRTQQRRSGYGY